MTKTPPPPRVISQSAIALVMSNKATYLENQLMSVTDECLQLREENVRLSAEIERLNSKPPQET